MPEPRADMFPESTDVPGGEPNNTPAEPVKVADPIPAPASAPASAPITPVPPVGIPYDKYHEVLKEKRALEAKVQLLERSGVSSDPLVPVEPASDEIGTLREQIGNLTQRIGVYEHKDAMNEVLTAYPQLVDKIEDFDSFLDVPENKILPLKTAAKIYLVDNNLLDAPKLPPKGLEKPSGGGTRVPAKQGMSIEDSERLRKNDPRKWIAMARAGQLPDDSLI